MYVCVCVCRALAHGYTLAFIKHSVVDRVEQNPGSNSSSSANDKDVESVKQEHGAQGRDGHQKQSETECESMST